MALIDSERDEHCSISYTVHMPIREYVFFLHYTKPFILKKIESLKKRLEKYEGRKEAGEATNRDIDKIMQIESKICDYEDMIVDDYMGHSLEDLIDKNKTK